MSLTLTLAGIAAPDGWPATMRDGAWVKEEPNTGDGLIIGLLVEYWSPLNNE